MPNDPRRPPDFLGRTMVRLVGFAVADYHAETARVLVRAAGGREVWIPRPRFCNDGSTLTGGDTEIWIDRYFAADHFDPHEYRTGDY